ncbi:hypothetical protein BgiMline_020458 [Biomphalaria glabrata]
MTSIKPVDNAQALIFFEAQTSKQPPQLHLNTLMPWLLLQTGMQEEVIDEMNKNDCKAAVKSFKEIQTLFYKETMTLTAADDIVSFN